MTTTEQFQPTHIQRVGGCKIQLVRTEGENVTILFPAWRDGLSLRDRMTCISRSTFHQVYRTI